MNQSNIYCYSVCCKVYCTLYILYTVNCTVNFTLFIQYTVQYTVNYTYCTVHFTIYIVHTVYRTGHCTLYILYTVHYTYCTLYIVHTHCIYCLPAGSAYGQAQLTRPSQNNSRRTHLVEYLHCLYWRSWEPQNFLNGVTTRVRDFDQDSAVEILNHTSISLSSSSV